MTTTEKLADACKLLLGMSPACTTDDEVRENIIRRTLVIDTLRAYEAEQAESQLPITEDLLREIGITRDTFRVYGPNEQGGFVVYPTGRSVMISCRGDAIRLISALGIEPKRET